MKRPFYLAATVFVLAFLAGCRDTSTTEKPLSEEEKRQRDSLSKIEQRKHADSLKKTNPLLIIPPDSTYTGDYVDKYPSGIVKFRGIFRFGKQHGQWMSYYPNGLAWSEMHFDKGLRHGPNITYYVDGKIRYTGFYKNDLKDSTWCYYDSLGALVRKIEFHNDRAGKESYPKK